MTSLEPLPPSPWPIQARPREVAELIVDWFNRYYEDVGDAQVEDEIGFGEQWIRSVVDSRFNEVPEEAITRVLSDLSDAKWRRRHDAPSEHSTQSERVLANELGVLIVTEKGEAISLGYGPEEHVSELQRRLRELEHDVGRLSSELERYPAPIGHNQPPRGFRLELDDLDMLQSVTIVLAGELAKPDRETKADVKVVDQAQKALASIIGKLRAAGKFVAENIVEGAAGAIVGMWITDPTALLERLESMQQTCLLWIQMLI